jgi:hypothetical protein
VKQGIFITKNIISSPNRATIGGYFPRKGGYLLSETAIFLQQNSTINAIYDQTGVYF